MTEPIEWHGKDAKPAPHPTADMADVYMELCAALMTMMDKSEVCIPERCLPMSPFEIHRSFEGDMLRVRLARPA